MKVFRGRKRPFGNGRKLRSAATADAAEVLRDRGRGCSGRAAGKKREVAGKPKAEPTFSGVRRNWSLRAKGPQKDDRRACLANVRKGSVEACFAWIRDWTLLELASTMSDWEPSGVARFRTGPETGPMGNHWPRFHLGRLPHRRFAAAAPFAPAPTASPDAAAPFRVGPAARALRCSPAAPAPPPPAPPGRSSAPRATSLRHT
jgi:hypothetical protein